MDLQTLNEDEFATLHPSVKKYLTAGIDTNKHGEKLVSEKNFFNMDLFNSDPYENLGLHFSSASVSTNYLQISLKSYFQSILMTDSLANVGLKFSSSASNDLFESVNFDLNHVNNKLEIFYVYP